jgi:hypothetical protein
LFDFDVASQVEPCQTTARTAHLNVGRVAIASSYGVVSDIAELGAEGAVEEIKRMELDTAWDFEKTGVSEWSSF